MQAARCAVALAAALALLATSPLGAQTYQDELAARVWLDRGEQPLLQRGDEVRLYYRASRDAYVALVHIDTNGNARMLLPRTPDDPAYVVGGRDYRLVFPESSTWYVDDDPGKGYFFVVASPTPMDDSLLRWDPYTRTWDLGEVGRQVYGDPYVAMDDYVAALIPDWEYAPYALDFLEYDVGDSHDYPRFLCYDCHGFRPYQAWNPYLHTCTTFRVVIWDDPYFYPARRYVGRQVVWTRPVSAWQPRFTFKERARGEPAIPLVRPSTARVVGPRNPVTGRPGRLERSSAGRDGMIRVPSSERGRIQYRPGGATRAAPSRPSAVLPGRSQGASGAVRGVPATGSRPSLQRRPAVGGTRAAPPGGAAPSRRGTGGAPPAASRRGGTPSTRVLPTRRSGGGSPPPAATPSTRRRTGGGAQAVRGSGSTRPANRSTPPSRAAPGTRRTTPTRAAPPTRRTTPTRAAPPTRRSGGGRAVPTQRPTRGGGGTARSAPPSRSGGGAARRPPPRRSRGGGGASR